MEDDGDDDDDEDGEDEDVTAASSTALQEAGPLLIHQALLAPGLKLATKAVLQAGIVCVGAKLSAFEVMKLGAVGIPVVLCSISAGLGSVIWINARLGLPARLGYLTAAGTSICGVTAIMAVAPAIQV